MPTVRKQAERKLVLGLLSLFIQSGIPDHRQRHPHSGEVFPPQFNLSGNIFIDTRAGGLLW